MFTMLKICLQYTRSRWCSFADMLKKLLHRHRRHRPAFPQRFHWQSTPIILRKTNENPPENELSSTPTALSPVEKTANFPSEIDSHPSTSTNEHLSLKHPGLLRLFDSTVCTASIVISYLFSSKEPLVQQFLGKKLFDYSPDELDFYLPQLINMYIHIPSISTVIHDYITSRSVEQRTSILLTFPSL